LVDTFFILGVDCDSTALKVAAENIADMEMDDRISLVQAQVGCLPCGNKQDKNRRNSKGGRGGRGARGSKGKGSNAQATPSADTPDNSGDAKPARFPLFEKCVDTVLTNPPFGTKPDKAGIDMEFLMLGCRLARRTVYSFHKTSTRSYILRKMNALPDISSAAVIAEMKFDVARTYKFHQHATVDVAVDLIRVELIRDSNDEDSDSVLKGNNTNAGDDHSDLDFDNDKGSVHDKSDIRSPSDVADKTWDRAVSN